MERSRYTTYESCMQLYGSYDMQCTNEPSAPRVSLADPEGHFQRFQGHQMEMIATKDGRRLFPRLAINCDNLQHTRHYSVYATVLPAADGQQQRYSLGWSGTGGKSDTPTQVTTYQHPQNGSRGDSWVKGPVVFEKLKISNSPTDHSILVKSMHQYQLVIYVVRHSDSSSRDECWEYTFPDRNFIAVTSYASASVKTIKIELNGFAKGHRQQSGHCSDLEGYTGEPAPKRRNSGDFMMGFKRSLTPSSGGYNVSCGSSTFDQYPALHAPATPSSLMVPSPLNPVAAGFVPSEGAPSDGTPTVRHFAAAPALPVAAMATSSTAAVAGAALQPAAAGAAPPMFMPMPLRQAPAPAVYMIPASAVGGAMPWYQTAPTYQPAPAYQTAPTYQPAPAYQTAPTYQAVYPTSAFAQHAAPPPAGGQIIFVQAAPPAFAPARVSPIMAAASS